MTRQEALQKIWERLLLIFSLLLVLSVIVMLMAGDFRAPLLLFICGNVGSYLSIHRNIGVLSDGELVELSGSWLGLIVPSFVGGILAIVLYLLFLSEIISGNVFPKFTPSRDDVKGVDTLIYQYADGTTEYAKLLFWGFVAGFNQEYVVKLIESIKRKT